jgi:hypothetical protein
MKGRIMNKLSIIFLFSFLIASQVFAFHPCKDDERIHKFAPEGAMLTFVKSIDAKLVGGVGGVQFDSGEILPLWESNKIGHATIRIVTSDKTLRGSYYFSKIQVPRGAESSDDTPFVFVPAYDQYLEINLYQNRASTDPRSETYITFGLLKENLGKHATITAQCED